MSLLASIATFSSATPTALGDDNPPGCDPTSAGFSFYMSSVAAIDGERLESVSH